MSTTLADQAGHTADKITVVSAIAHVAIAALGVFVAAQNDGDPGATTFWLLAAFCTLGLVATLLGWASVKAGRVVWNVGIAVLVVSLGVLAWATTSDGGLAVLGIGVAFLFVDWLLFANAHRAIG
jgi:cytochrome bd-type quinol oxidase subunit 1